MSQEELAQQSNISRQTISALENGTARTTTTKTLLAIAGAFGVNIEDLFYPRIVELIKH